MSVSYLSAVDKDHPIKVLAGRFDKRGFELSELILANGIVSW
jgi:hypothetical protein